MNGLKKKRWWLSTLLVLTISTAFGRQAEGQTLTDKYGEMLEKSETYEKYKVIATAKLDDFWSEVEDSLASYRKSINGAHMQVAEIDKQLKVANDSLLATLDQLQASQAVNDQITFLGIQLNKSFYNVVVWGIVGCLLGVLAFLFASFKNSHQVTSRARKDLAQVTEELENLRQRSNEKQVKLKRELQTALNQLEESRKKSATAR